MSIAPPVSNSSASSTTSTAPTYTTSKVLEGHEPNIPGRVSDKYSEGLEDSSKRPKENIKAQEDLIKSLPRKDVSFGAQAALDRDRVPLVKRTEVHAVPAETSIDNLLKDKQISVSDVQITPTTSQSRPAGFNQPNDMLSRIALPTKSSTRDSGSNHTEQLSKQDKQWSESASREENLNTRDSGSKPDSSDLSSHETSTLHSKFTNQLSNQDKQVEESAHDHQQQLIAQKPDKEIIPLQKDGSFQAQTEGTTESTTESIKNQLIDTKEKVKDMLQETKAAMTSPSQQDSNTSQDMSMGEQAQQLKQNVSEKWNDAKDTMKASLPSTNQDSSNDTLGDKAENLKENAKEKLMEAKDTAQNKLDQSSTSLQSQQQDSSNESWGDRAQQWKENAKEKLMEAKDTVETQLHQSREQVKIWKDEAKDKLNEAKDTLQNKWDQYQSGASLQSQQESGPWDKAENLKENAKEKWVEAKDTAQNKLDQSSASLQSQQQDSSNESSWGDRAQQWKDNAKEKLMEAKDTVETQLHQSREQAKIWKDEAKDKLMEAKDTVQNKLNTSTEPSTAKQWEDQHMKPFDIPRTSTEQRETREESEGPSSDTDSVLPTDQYDLKQASDKSSETLETKPPEPSHMISDTLAGLVHTVTHLPERAKQLFTKSEESSTHSKAQPSSTKLLPTDLYDLEIDKQREAEREPTEPLDTTKSTETVMEDTQKVMEEKHVEPFDDHKTEPKQHSFIQDKIANLVHTVTELPTRAKEMISKHEENKSNPPSPREGEIPTIQEREEKSPQQSESLVKTREFTPEEVSFF